MMLEPALVEPLIVEGAEYGRQATQSPDEPELSEDYVDNIGKLCGFRELESVLGTPERSTVRRNAKTNSNG